MHSKGWTARSTERSVCTTRARKVCGEEVGGGAIGEKKGEKRGFAFPLLFLFLFTFHFFFFFFGKKTDEAANKKSDEKTFAEL